MEENMKASTFVDENGNVVELVDAQAREELGKRISVEAQELTAEQKDTARKNIGLGNFPEGGIVEQYAADSINVYPAPVEGWQYNTFLKSNGAFISHTGYITTPQINLKPNTTYTMTPKTYGGLEEQNRAWAYDEFGTPVSYLIFVENEDGSVTFTTPDDTVYVHFSLRKDVAGNETTPLDTFIENFNGKFMIVEGTSVPTSFIPYIPSGLRLKGVELPVNAVKLESFKSDVRAIVAPLSGMKIVNFGDSIFGNSRPPNDVSTVIAALSGATVYNCAFGGCRMAQHSGHWDAFSMYRLADAIATGDWSLQDEALNHDDRTSYAETPLALLKSVNFDDVDIITINYCTNDWNGGNVVDGDGTDEFDTDTYLGALRYSAKKIHERYPHIKIVILSATWRFFMDGEGAYTGDGDNTTKNNLTLKQYVDRQKEETEKLHLQYVDLYNIGINKYNRGHFFPSNDGTHQNANGRLRIAEKIVKELY